MGFLSFFKKTFSGNDADELALDDARRRHGVIAKDEATATALKYNQEARRQAQEYNVWEELDRYRWYFFVGGWAARKIRPIGEEKVKLDLERLEKKRLKEEEKKKREG